MIHIRIGGVWDHQGVGKGFLLCEVRGKPFAFLISREVFTLLGVILIVLYEACQPEVSDLADQILPHQDVGCSQVSVDIVHAFHVGHALSYLGGRGKEVRGRH